MQFQSINASSALTPSHTGLTLTERRSLPDENKSPQRESKRAEWLASMAVTALREEALLTPKPALVDRRGSGAHVDLTLPLMLASASTLHTTFVAMARAAHQQRPSRRLREHLAALGRAGEQAMLTTTCGVNTHRGAIWALGLLVAAAAFSDPGTPAHILAERAGKVARYPDRSAPYEVSHGLLVQQRHGISGAREEAQRNFPHVINEALPMLAASRAYGLTETHARLNTLIVLIAHLSDTCILYRGGPRALQVAQSGARGILVRGGTSTPRGWETLCELDRKLLTYHVSPGGSADLLAATLFLTFLEQESRSAWAHF
ncbi:triphosphoribosyl-dephospho-CoA synthase [Ktedonospora formicarum]|uniref:triphosphoribosyl-dephospho-CoA synthase n=1 Tax=Ktedonospora formicarum TaxID=2778364 RepID=A0A8J3IDY1_9CHLR|nr:triphosphoribosyl-dephospho-CoA synthase [Ktedonospora formicarum]GHO50992.1 2-(5''-triphosphoribosyl)-3'-dephosphocoenzyme-A synthase [Ktedonospora formicarum]